MALVFLLIFCLTLVGRILNESSLTSTKTGFPPQYSTASAVAEKVNVGKITSSPGLIFRPAKQRCRPCVAAETPREYFDLNDPLNLFSNFSRFGPLVSHLCLNARITAFSSSFVIQGLKNGIFNEIETDYDV